MKKIYLFLIAYIIPLGASCAESVFSHIIREDRVWEYVYNIGEVWNQMFRLKFEGKEEHEGRTYHRLVHTGDLVGWKSDYDYDKDEYVTWGREDSPNDNDMVYLMREEEGRVYLLNSNMGESLDWAFDPQPAPKEVLIYDFNMKAGESYNLLAGIWDWNSEPEWHCAGDWAQCEIISTDTVEIDGEECIVQNASFVLLNNLKIIDGIGFAEHGFLPFLCCDMRTTLFRSNYNLNRVYNAAGEVIYRGLDIDPETVSVDAIETLPSTTLSYDGVSVQAVNPAGNSITLSLLDISGTLMSRSEGSETAVASTAALTPGVYVAIAQADGATVTRRKFVVR